MNLYSRNALSANALLNTHVMNCRTDVLKDFDNKTEVMGLKCPCGNAEGINDLILQCQTLVHIGALSFVL